MDDHEQSEEQSQDLISSNDAAEEAASGSHVGNYKHFRKSILINSFTNIAFALLHKQSIS